MKKLHLLIMRSYAGPAIATFFVVVFVLLMQFLWKYVDELVGKGLEWKVILKLMYYASYTFVPTALPISILLASLMTFGNLGERYELVAIKAAGISLRKVLFPLGVFAILISVGAFFYSNIVFPYANLKFRSTLYDVRQKKMSFNIREGIFYSGLDGYIIKIGKKGADGSSIGDVMIYDHTQLQGNTKLTLADSGFMKKTADGSYLLLTLFNGTNYDESGPRDNSNHPFQRTKFTEQTIKFDLSQFKMTHTDDQFFRNAIFMLNISQLNKASDSLGKDLNLRVKEVSNSVMSNYHRLQMANLNDKLYTTLKPETRFKPFDKLSKDDQRKVLSYALGSIQNIKSSFEYNKQLIKEKAELKAKHDIEWHRKFTLSVACFALFLIGAPLGAIIRKGGLGMPLVISVLLFVIYHVISFTMEKSVRKGITTAWEGMWLSTFIFIPIGIFLIYKAATDSNIMDAESYKLFFSKIVKWFKKYKKHENISAVQ